jgi:hypothetical protein
MALALAQHQYPWEQRGGPVQAVALARLAAEVRGWEGVDPAVFDRAARKEGLVPGGAEEPPWADRRWRRGPTDDDGGEGRLRRRS